MTVKEELRELIESLDEDAAAEALSFVRRLVAEQGEGDDAHPLWGIAGIGRSKEPTNVAKYKDDYLAEAYEARHES